MAFTMLAGCAQGSADGLGAARRHLKPVPCGTTPAVADAAGPNANPREVYLGDWIVLSVCHLDQLVKDAQAQQQPITLFIEGIDSGNRLVSVDADSGTAVFILDRTPDNTDLWRPLLYNPLGDRTASINVGAGIREGRALPRAPGASFAMQLNKLYVDWTSLLWLALLAAVMVGLVTYARKSDMLRVGPALNGARQAYSLGHVQMAWWFFLILSGYLFIWFITGDRDVLAPSALVLLGISAATAITATAIVPEGGPLGPRRKMLDDEIKATDSALQQLTVDLAGSASATNVALHEALAAKRAELESRRAALVVQRAGLTTFVPSAGFWKDLVSDERRSVALDRFQIVAWTAVLGGLFVTSVMLELTMPEFSATLLTLMGISSGTYIGFKLPKT